ncbi:hypothetical protein AB0G42_03940 [Streptomyces yangpuensis]|uniref:hypothetical protein n=1 Tax=Streptomyces TaxID=1883 RepID=UPI001601F81E|nr:hypothetical protein [Streptomyces sp. gCLA4]
MTESLQSVAQDHEGEPPGRSRCGTGARASRTVAVPFLRVNRGEGGPYVAEVPPLPPGLYRVVVTALDRRITDLVLVVGEEQVPGEEKTSLLNGRVSELPFPVGGLARPFRDDWCGAAFLQGRSAGRGRSSALPSATAPGRGAGGGRTLLSCGN